MTIKQNQIMKCILLCFLMIANYQMGFTQDQKNQLDKELEALRNYTKNAEGKYYVIAPIDESMILEGLEEIKNLIDQKGIEIRASQFRIEDVNLGPLSYMIIRKFSTQEEADAFIDLIDEHAKLSKGKGMSIAQVNYRKFLKKRDIEEYRLFISSK